MYELLGTLHVLTRDKRDVRPSKHTGANTRNFPRFLHVINDGQRSAYTGASRNLRMQGSRGLQALTPPCKKYIARGNDLVVGQFVFLAPADAFLYVVLLHGLQPVMFVVVNEVKS